MPWTRRSLLTLPLAAAAFAPSRAAQSGEGERGTKAVPRWETPLFDLPSKIDQPVKIESIELLRRGNDYFVRTRSSDGVEGLTKTKQIADYVPIFENLVAPIYRGRDARDLESLIDEVYVKNYKIAGQPFWTPVAYIEQSLWDLLGKTVNKPVGALMGEVIRKEIPIYLSGSGRDNTAEQEVDVYVQGVEQTGARAAKFKIGGRMSRNLDAYPGRTDTLLELAHKKLGDKVLLYADANGSYDSTMGIEVGKRLEQLGFGFFEEPCPWEELSETRKVAEALEMPVAAGEQDASLWRFEWMMDNEVMDIVQPDLNYNGGFVRAARVARMARSRGLQITPHNTQTGATAVNMLHFASVTPNIGPYMEFPWRRPHKPQSYFTPNFPIRDGKVRVPTGPGMGVEFDPDYIAAAEVLVR